MEQKNKWKVFFFGDSILICFATNLHNKYCFPFFANQFGNEYAKLKLAKTTARMILFAGLYRVFFSLSLPLKS